MIFDDELKQQYINGDKLNLSDVEKYLNMNDTITILQDKSTKEGHQQRVTILGVTSTDPFQMKIMAVNIKDKEG